MAKKDRYQVSLKAFLKNEEGELLAMAKDKGSFAGLYDFPGGRIEEDEFTTPLKEILMRELKEEIGDVDIDLEDAPVAVGRHLIPSDVNKQGEDVPEIHVLYVFFEGLLKNGDVSISSEHSGYEWLKTDAIIKEPKKYFSSGNLEAVVSYLGKGAQTQ